MTPRRSEEGVTLIELIVVVLVMGIIVAPLTTAVMTSLITTQQSLQRTGDTTDQQILASYFEHDVQSADTVSVPATSACGGAGAVVEFQWEDPVGPIDKTVAYVVTGTEMTRVSCESPGSTKSVPVTHALQSTPVAQCTTAGTTAPCTAAASTPESVSLDITVIGSSTGASRETHNFTLSATRRVTA